MDMQPIRIHILSLPHTRLTGDYAHCAFTQKARKLAMMMHNNGHEVFLYGSGDSQGYEEFCAEYIPVFSEEEFNEWFPIREHLDWNNPVRWQLFNERCANEVNKRTKPKDICASTFGNLQQPALMSTNCIPIETGIGYTGVFAPFQVYESYAIKNYISGVMGLMNNPRHYDTVIPNYYDLSEFEYRETPDTGDDEYFFFIGRINIDKGFATACRAAKQLGTKIKLAGVVGDQELFAECLDYGNVEYLGVITSEERAKVMSGAKATFVPTLYVEPFGGVHVESWLSGTPVITSDVGIFPETVQNGYNGFRCGNLAEFVEAAGRIDEIDRKTCREFAEKNFSLDAIYPRYEYYFRKVLAVADGATYDSLDIPARTDMLNCYFMDGK
jgi:glycosyltransferase involved in cell wall biosynthesis